ncbi:MAG: FKBP-type peptidyl-prolyl cis-trans isomerase [Flavobacteriales bacterium]|nr:FKBP-type peptidyl-prolyl cis-trans isomerase [Flavobacteriales bacterium]
MKKLGFGLSILIASSALFSCGEKTTSKYPGYDKVEEGMFVKYFNKNKEGRAVAVGDVLTASMQYGTEDTTIFDTQVNGQPVQLRADSAKYEGDFLGIFLQMNEGDSVSVIVNANDFFLKTAQMPQAPDFIDSNSMLYFTIGLNKVQSLDELQAEAKVKNSELEGQEGVILDQYLAENGITVAPTESGLIFISKVEGSGKQAETNKKVKVNYAGMLLNGTYFDTSIEDVAKEQGMHNPQRTYGPFEFQLGLGQVIPGWDEGIAMLKEGGKARLIIPSNLGYGANPRPGGVIQPFSTLIFDVELIEVID